MARLGLTEFRVTGTEGLDIADFGWPVRVVAGRLFLPRTPYRHTRHTDQGACRYMPYLGAPHAIMRIISTHVIVAFARSGGRLALAPPGRSRGCHRASSACPQRAHSATSPERREVRQSISRPGAPRDPGSGRPARRAPPAPAAPLSRRPQRGSGVPGGSALLPALCNQLASCKPAEVGQVLDEFMRESGGRGGGEEENRLNIAWAEAEKAGHLVGTFAR